MENDRCVSVLPLYQCVSSLLTGDWTNAASHLERSVRAIGSQYGEDSVELGHQLFKLAQLYFNR